MERKGEASVSVRGTSEAMRAVADAFDAFAATHALPEDLVQSVQIALDELVSNAVRHGFGPAGNPGAIEVRFRVAEDTLELTVSDDAPPFNPLDLPEPDTSLPIEERPIGGLGVLLVRRLMDRVEYRRADGRNEVSLWKQVVD